MTALLLRKDAYACQTDDGAVFMDMDSERYFGLGAVEACALNGRVTGWNIPRPACATVELVDDDAIINSLIESGLLTRDPVNGKPAEFCSLKISDAIHYRGTIAPRPRIRILDICNVAYACSRALLDLRFRPLAGIVERIRKRNTTLERRSTSSADVYHLVRVFRLLTPFLYTANGRCLFDSLALAEFLSRYGLRSLWVIGVRTRPFGAHSWVQYGPLVLNEKLETVEEFTAILVV